MLHYFGNLKNAEGFSTSSTQNNKVADIVNGIMTFESGIQFREFGTLLHQKKM